MMTFPNLTTSELCARMKELDCKLIHCLGEFASDTGIEITEVTIHWRGEENQFELNYGMFFPEE